MMRADDYSYGLEVYDTWIKTGSFWEAVKCAAEHTKKFYFSWQGTYASCFLMCICCSAYHDWLTFNCNIFAGAASLCEMAWDEG